MADILKFLTESSWAISIRILLILVVAKSLVQVIRRVAKKKVVEPHLLIQHFLVNILVATVYLLAGIICIGQIPQLNSAFRTLLAGSGILALAISFSAQESLSNLISGIFIAVFRPFEIGDRITIVGKNLTGTVEDITLRHTVIKTFINSRVVVPNSVISKEILENSNIVDSRASSFVDVMISYESDIDKAMRLMAEIIGEHPFYVDVRTENEKKVQPKVKVYVREFGDNGIWLRASMWTKTVDENFSACSDVRLRIIKDFAICGIEIPYQKVDIRHLD